MRPTTTRDAVSREWRIRLDTSDQVLGVELLESWEVGETRPPSPTLPGGDTTVSAAELLWKAKRFDDGLVAAVSLMEFRDRAALLGEIAANGTPDAAAFALACREVGDVPLPVPAELEPVVRKWVDPFLADETRSKPLGFYTWSPELTAAFRLGKLAQSRQEPAALQALLAALDGDAARQYARIRRLNDGLTNPPARGQESALFPASRSHEQQLFDAMFGIGPVPRGFDLMAELAKRVRSGEIDLKPRPDSGWYDWQTWALETLAAPDRAPEASRLKLGPEYRKHLLELFRGFLALARETHVAQGCYGGGGGGRSVPPVIVTPDLTVEPLPEVYARRAAGYRFLAGVLDQNAAFGEAWRRAPRLGEAGPTGPGLGAELESLASLLEGAAAAARRDLGMPAPGDPSAFDAWAAGRQSDPDLGGDVRMMVPVFFDQQRRRTKVWAVLGWRGQWARVRYEHDPSVIAVARADNRPASQVPNVLFGGQTCRLAAPVTAEVYASRLLNRDEFRRLCDRHRTPGAILAALT